MKTATVNPIFKLVKQLSLVLTLLVLSEDFKFCVKSKIILT